MKFCALLLVMLGILGQLATAAPEPTAHWFQITVVVGEHKETLTGSSRFDAPSLGSWIVAGTAVVTLENLRDSGFYVDAKTYEWRAVQGMKSVNILPRSIVYFYELPEDPLITQAAERAKVEK
jgi:hypothetical protein